MTILLNKKEIEQLRIGVVVEFLGKDNYNRGVIALYLGCRKWQIISFNGQREVVHLKNINGILAPNLDTYLKG